MAARILFAIPKVKSLSKGKSLTVHPHAGVAYLCSFLKNNGFEIQIFDDGVEDNRAGLLETLQEFNPQLIGVTVFGYSYQYARELIKVIKQNCAIPVVLGGPHVSTIRKVILTETAADFAIKLEGEYTLLELMRAIQETDRDYSKIQGLIWRDSSDSIVENIDRPLNQNLDSLPFPDYDAFKLKKYYCYKSNTLPIITSRGCPFSCNFCSVKLSMGGVFRARSAKNIIDEIEHFVKKGWRNFDINDDCFTLDKIRVEEICDLIINEKIDIRFQFPNGIRADTVSPRLLQKLKQAGCVYIFYGCETGSERILRLIRKGITLKQVRMAVEWTNDAGIDNAVNFIIGHTQETYHDALDTIAFAKSLPTNFVHFFNLIPYPGTEAYDWAMRHANFLVSRKRYLWQITSEQADPVFETAEFTKRQRKRVMKIGLNLFKKMYLRFRFGMAAGSLAYYITRISPLEKLAIRFILDSQFGKFIYAAASNLFQMSKKNQRKRKLTPLL